KGAEHLDGARELLAARHECRGVRTGTSFRQGVAPVIHGGAYERYDERDGNDGNDQRKHGKAPASGRGNPHDLPLDGKTNTAHYDFISSNSGRMALTRTGKAPRESGGSNKREAQPW